MQQIWTRLSLLGLLTSACGGTDIDVPASQQTGPYGTPAKLSAYLDGKMLRMEGASIPSHPNGYDQDVNFGQATQCYKKVEMSMQAGRFHVDSELGTLMNAPNPGDRGECDRATAAATLTFDSTAVLIENVMDDGACFDITVTYPGFGQEGRGHIAADGGALELELYFKDQAIGHRCADGEVGAPGTVTLNQDSFTGNSVQRYAVTE